MTKAIKYEPAISPLDFSRGSSGTYFDNSGVLQTAAADEARLTHGPESLEAQGLLIEEQRTNTLRQSENLSDTVWTKQEITLGATEDLFGNIQTQQVVADNAATSPRLLQTPAYNTDNIYWISLYIKASGVNSVDINPGTAVPGLIRVNLSDGSFTILSAGILSPSIIPQPNGYYLVTFGIDMSTRIEDNGRFYTQQIDNLDGVSGYYVGGFQIELGSFPTSYIKTEGSQVTRGADNCSRTLGSEFNPSEGTFVATFKRSFLKTTLNHLLNIGEGIILFYNGGLVAFAWGVTPNVTFSLTPNNDDEDFLKFAVSYNGQSGIAVANLNGQSDTLTTEDQVLINTNDLTLFNNSSGSRQGHGLIESLRFIPRALSATELEELTA